MPASCQKLFETLNESQLQYCAFKSLEWLEKDYDGKRGDIDLLTNNMPMFKSIAESAGFRQQANLITSSFATFFTGWDIESDRFLLLHVHPTPVAVRKRRIISRVWVYQNNTSPLGQRTPHPTRPLFTAPESWVSEYETKKLQVKSSMEPPTKCGFKISIWATITESVTRNVSRFAKHFSPSYPTRKFGSMVALIGVDGAGKSSAIESLLSSPYLQRTAKPKKIYFGSHSYRLPGIKRLARLSAGSSKNSSWSKLYGIFSRIDKKLRLFLVLYYRFCGRTVLCDRYIYDSIAGNLASEPKSRKNALLRRFDAWMPLRPSLTIYLKISAAKAYERKQDYDFATMQRMVEIYDSLMSSYSETVTVNAEQEQSLVQRDIRKTLSEWV